MSAVPIPKSLLMPTYEAYIRAGFHLVPITSGKGPKTQGWNLKSNTVASIEQLEGHVGYGLAHAYSGTMALDIDVFEDAKLFLAKHSIDLQALIDDPSAVTIESGNYGHAKLLYAMPFGMALNSKKLINNDSQGNRYNFLDFRCATSNGLTVQDVLPSAVVHPKTQQPYKWGGRGHFSALPAIPQALLSLWQSLLETDNKQTLKTDSMINASWSEVKSALNYINPDCNRDQWVAIGMALQAGGASTNELDTAYQIFDEWSAQGQKYQGSTDINNCWRSFKPDGNITLGTLFHHAIEGGYKRPMPDVSHMFQGVTPTKPEELIDLVTLRQRAPICDLSLFPSVIANRATELGEMIGLDPVIPLMAGIATVCGAVDSRTRLKLSSSFKVPPILWLMTIGDPSDSKSPGSKPMVEILERMEREDRERYKVEKLIWEGKEAAHIAAKKNYLEHASSGMMTSNTVAPSVPELPPQPVPLRLIAYDTTSQMLVRLVEHRPRGLLLFLDEMSNWIKRANSKDASGDDRGTWIKGYEAGSHHVDRVSAGSISIDNVSMAIYGNLQPEVLKRELAGMADDGLLQRFIPISVDPDATREGFDKPEFLQSFQEYESAIRLIYSLPPTTYELSDGALQAFQEFNRWRLNIRKYEKILKTSGIYQTAFGKITGTCGRFALIFHLLENPQSQYVSKETMDRTIEAMKRYIIPTLRFNFAKEENQLDQWIIDHVIHIAGELKTVSVSDVKRSAKRLIERIKPYMPTLDEDIRAVLDEMVKHHWLTLIEDNRKTVNYYINENIAQIYPDYRKSVINAKQAIKELIAYNSGATSVPPVYGYDPQERD